MDPLQRGRPVHFWTPTEALYPSFKRAKFPWVCDACLAMDYYQGIFLGNAWVNVHADDEGDPDFIPAHLEAATCLNCQNQYGLDPGHPLSWEEVPNRNFDPIVGPPPPDEFPSTRQGRLLVSALRDACTDRRLVCLVRTPMPINEYLYGLEADARRESNERWRREHPDARS